MHNFLTATWPVAKHIVAGTTTRLSGYSDAPFDGFNLATHVGDNLNTVLKNRKFLSSELMLPNNQQWLNQVHGCNIINACNNENACADAIVTQQKNTVCVVLTADCLPILVSDKFATCVAAIHAGWRGLRDGIIEKTILRMPCKVQDCVVWIGPAISAAMFEVDDSVRNEFLKLDHASKIAFIATGAGHWNMDLVKLAGLRLANIGITEQAVYGADQCSYLNKELFYSYRRNKITGRMASLIYIRDI